MSPWKRIVKQNLAAGLLAILPLWLTLYVSWLFVKWFGGIFGAFLRYLPGMRQLPYFFSLLLGFFLLICLIILTGFLASNLLGRKFLAWAETVVARVPVVRRLYGAGRQLTDMVFLTRAAFRRVALVEFPRRGTYAVGFLTSDARWGLARGEEALAVFVPSTPNPTTGWLIVVPKGEVYPTNLSVEAGIKLVVSGGIISPGSAGIAPAGPES